MRADNDKIAHIKTAQRCLKYYGRTGPPSDRTCEMSRRDIDSACRQPERENEYGQTKIQYLSEIYTQ